MLGYVPVRVTPQTMHTRGINTGKIHAEGGRTPKHNGARWKRRRGTADHYEERRTWRHYSNTPQRNRLMLPPEAIGDSSSMLSPRAMSESVTTKWQWSVSMTMAYITTRELEDDPGWGSHWDRLNVQGLCRTGPVLSGCVPRPRAEPHKPILRGPRAPLPLLLLFPCSICSVLPLLPSPSRATLFQDN